LGQVSIVSHSYQTYFGFLGSDLNLDCGLRDHVITRFASDYIISYLLKRIQPRIKTYVKQNKISDIKGSTNTVLTILQSINWA
jgi:hypothetical protein